MMRNPFQEIENRAEKNDRESFRLKQEVIILSDTNRNLISEISRLKSNLAHVDNEKDKCLNTIDEKTVENVKLRKEITSYTQINKDLNEQLNNLNNMIDNYNCQMGTMSNELNNLKISSEYLKLENMQLRETIDSNYKDSRQLQDDLLTITRENQVLHAELEKNNSDNNNLKEQLQEYIHQVTKLNDVISNHECENEKLRSNIDQLTSELNSIQNNLSQSENERFGLRMELQIKNLDLKRLKDKFNCMEKEFCKKISECQEYEVKMSVAARNLQRSEDHLNKLKIEMKELTRDMINFRELNTRLEQVKDDLSRQVTKKEINLDTLKSKFEDISAENELLKSHLNGERSMVKQLEELIASNREKDFRVQINNQKVVSEVKLLKDRILLGDEKLNSLNREIDRLKTKISELEAENDILKRQLYNSKFNSVIIQNNNKLNKSSENF